MTRLRQIEANSIGILRLTPQSGARVYDESEQFRAPDLARLKAIMTRPVVVDLRNVYRPEDMAKHGFVLSSSRKGLPATAGALEPFPSRVAAE
jgi:hypothetical protein